MIEIPCMCYALSSHGHGRSCPERAELSYIYHLLPKRVCNVQVGGQLSLHGTVHTGYVALHVPIVW